jgi:hypothetical protein
MRSIVRPVAVALGAAAAAFAVLQLIPYGPKRLPPIGSAQVAWADEQTHDLASRACLDCHGGETRWPWYTSIAPGSWIAANHVAEGRAMFDVSAPNPGEEAYEAGESVREGEMPPWYYVFLHPEARLTLEEKRALAMGLDATFGGEEEGGEVAEAGHGDDDDDEDDD